MDSRKKLGSEDKSSLKRKIESSSSSRPDRRMEPETKKHTNVKDIVSASKDKMSIKLSGVIKKQPVQPIKITLLPHKVQEEKVAPKPSLAVRNVFNADDSDEEEMPPEARMKMRNVGRDTPTSSGPNSFGKGRMGFVDRRKLMEKEMERIQEQVAQEDAEVAEKLKKSSASTMLRL